MAILPAQLARVSNLLRGNIAQGQIALTQRRMLQAQNELTTGKRINVASDDPGAAAIVQQLQKTLEQRQSFLTNLTRARNHLSEVDSTLGDLNDLIQRAQEIASANVGSDVTPDQRSAASAVVEQIYSEALSLANKQFEGVYLFAGDRSTEQPFVATDGGVRFVGSENVLQNAFDEGTNLPFMVNGAEVFGALSSRVRGSVDLSPSLTAQTRLADLRGATGAGVRPGLVTLSNGTQAATIDLRTADTIGDLLAAINAAGVGGVTAAIGGAGNQITLAAGPADNVTVQDAAGGTAAADLGILRTVGAGAGVPLIGTSVGPRVTALAPLSALRNGAGIDTAGGLRITNGAATVTVDLSSATTVEGLLNAVNGSGANVLARINADATGIDIVNPTQGTRMSVAENGGTTAADLGVRSFDGNSLLADFNDGKGVRSATGADFRVTRSDGTTFDVDLTAAAATAQDVINAINAADGGAGVTASLAATGNGIVLTDTAGGAGTLAVTPLNFSDAAADLGLLAAPAAGNVITGADANPVAAAGVFADLAKLRDALKGNDPAGITAAAEGLSADYVRATRVRGETGARVQGLESRQGRLEDQDVATQSLLSTLSDTDFTEAISRFQTLQNSLQASMQTTASILHLSLLDFLG
jgi:flagellin-like hook-associated protein FlgL